jgi:hypothetical protein
MPAAVQRMVQLMCTVTVTVQRMVQLMCTVTVTVQTETAELSCHGACQVTLPLSGLKLK